MTKPLAGVRIVEFDGLGPGPLATRFLLDQGAEVTVIVRPQIGSTTARLFGEQGNPWHRGKTCVPLDLKTAADLERALELVAVSDVLVEANRPGVMERLGLGPPVCLASNPKLIYGRMTGWGQTGPLSQAAGHDLNYVALSGLLSLSMRPGEMPIIPPTVIGDGAGALGLAYGITCALLDVRNGGAGRVIDAAILDVTAMIGGIAQSIRAAGEIDGSRPSPFHDSPFYDVYRCADDGFITICALEPQFYQLLLTRLDMHDVDPAAQYDRILWPPLKQRMRELFLGRPRDAWCRLLEGTDVCFAPVLSIDEAVRHPHNVARALYTLDENGAVQPAPAPRL